MSEQKMASTTMQLQQHGVSPEHMATLTALPSGSIDWKHILALVAQYGPTVVGWILFLTGKGPMPATPFPAQLAQGARGAQPGATPPPGQPG